MMYKDRARFTLFVVMFVLFIQCVSAIDAGESYTLKTINCYDDASIKVRGEDNISRGEYIINDCKEEHINFWKCPCNNGEPLSIILSTKNTTKNVYDIVLEYNVLSEKDRGTIVREGVVIHDEGKRTDNFNDIYVGMKPIDKIKEKFKMPEIPGGWNFIMMVGVILGVIIFTGGIIYLFIRFLFTDKEEDNNIAPKKVMQTNKKDKEDEMSDEELDNLLKDL